MAQPDNKYKNKNIPTPPVGEVAPANTDAEQNINVEPAQEVQTTEGTPGEVVVSGETIEPKVDEEKVEGESVKDPEPTQDENVDVKTEPEEIKDVPEVIEKPEVAVGGDLSVDDVKKLLINPEVTVDDKLVKLSTFAPTGIKILVNKLLDYEKTMATITVENELKGANKNYDLFNTLLKVISEEDYNMFKVQFDIVNLVFLKYKDSSFEEVNLQRFDHKWNHGKENFTSYCNLVYLISLLASAAEREVNSKKVVITKVFDQSKTVFTADHLNKVSRYYNIH